MTRARRVTASLCKLPVEYVLPLRWTDDRDCAELTEYLLALQNWVDITVVDGSDDPIFNTHHRVWSFIRHVKPTVPGKNGKARGAMTGLSTARHEKVIIADDDVRYDTRSLHAVFERFGTADAVRPQNYFAERPWHARWDTGRTLLNRALGGDYSGTVAVRAPIVLDGGGYDTDVLFENLELERTVRARGGRVDIAADVFVARKPPTLARFLEQRVRQAYDDFALPVRLISALLILPSACVAIARGRAHLIGIGAVIVVAIAEHGRRRHGGTKVFGGSDPLWALPWVAERAVTSWIALAARAAGGIRYRDAVITRSASSVRRRRRKSS